ncbi:MAG: hypothetical protein HYV47_02875 [Candidatus Nealsonbacteria bacterium]|nr:hypothetical protein [Candidatus Nealsonbacteria bacterium]
MNPIEKVEKNQYIRLIAVIAVVLGAFITIVTFFGNIQEYLYDNVFTSKNISDKMNSLSAGQSINFFKQELGAEKLQRTVSEKYTEYIFQYKSSFIQALVNKENNEVIYWAITYCGSNPVVIIRKVFSTAQLYTGEKDFFGRERYDYVFGKNIRLNESSFIDIFQNEKGDFKYFVSGATANSFAYESLYVGNPGAYQTLIIGVNDICSSIEDLYKYLSVMNNSSQEQIQEFRRVGRVNTYGETAPFAGDEVLQLLNSQHSIGDPYITFGVDRIKVRYFND